MNHQSDPADVERGSGLQLYVNSHKRKRAPTRLVFARILKVGLAISFSYAALSQAFILKKWAGQNAIAITDDDTPQDFFWQEGEGDPGGDDNWPRHKNKKREFLFEPIGVDGLSSATEASSTLRTPAPKMSLKEEEGGTKHESKDEDSPGDESDKGGNDAISKTDKGTDERREADDELKDDPENEPEDEMIPESQDEDEDETLGQEAEEELKSQSRKLDDTLNNHTLHLIPRDQVEFLDKFSDSWLIPKRSLLSIDIETIDFVEQACFQIMIRQNARMTLDWTDFMVEHLSKWWGELQVTVDMDNHMFEHTIHILQDFIDRQAQEVVTMASSAPFQTTTRTRNDDSNTSNPATTKNGSSSSSSYQSPLHPTIAMIAYQTYESVFKERERLLSPHSLAATLMSLIQIGFGRILVVGYKEDDWNHVWGALKIVATKVPGSILEDRNATSTNSITSFSMTVLDHTEIAYVQIPDQTWVKTEHYKINVPRGVLQGMLAAIRGNLTKRMHNTSAEEWLGTTHDRSYWQYFYLTEPDTILHTKSHVLTSIRDGLDQGIMYMPHRLQPLPHEYNLPPPPAKLGKNQQVTKGNKYLSRRYKGRYLPGDIHPFSNISFLGKDDHCCDAGKGWPGRSPEFGEKQIPCDTWWWGCGFSRKNEDVHQWNASVVREIHKRLLAYPIMSLKSGTGIIFGPSEQGRRCFPSKELCSFTFMGEDK